MRTIDDFYFYSKSNAHLFSTTILNFKTLRGKLNKLIEKCVW